MARPRGSKDKVPRNLGVELAQVDNQAYKYIEISQRYYIPYDQYEVPFYIRLKMLDHPQIQAGLTFAEAILSNTKFYHDFPKPEKTTTENEILEYANWGLSDHWTEIVVGSLLARCAGFSPFEKIYTIETIPGKGDYLGYEKIKYIDPASVELYLDGNGNYAGFGQKRYNVDRIPPEKTFWFTHRPQKATLRHNPLLGWPEFGKELYDIWYRNTIIWQMFVRFLGKKVNPPTIGWAPAETRKRKKADGTSETYNLMKVLHDVLQKLNEGSVVTLPYEVDEHGEKKVDVKYLESQRMVGEYLQALNSTEAQLFYGIFVPPSIFVKLTNSAAGSYAMMESMVDVFLMMLKGTVNLEIRQQVQDQLTADLVRRQFGDNAPIPILRTTLETASFRKALIDSLLVAEKNGKWVPDVDESLRILDMPKSAYFNPKEQIGGVQNAGRVGGAKDPSRTGEETGRVGGGTDPRQQARGQ